MNPVDTILLSKFKSFYIFIKQLELELAPKLTEKSYNCYKRFFEECEQLFTKYECSLPLVTERIDENIHQIHTAVQIDYNSILQYLNCYPEPIIKKQFKLDVAAILDSFMKNDANPINMDDFSSPSQSPKSSTCCDDSYGPVSCPEAPQNSPNSENSGN